MASNKGDDKCVVDDDFFGDQTAANATDASEREWNALRRVHVKAGYREGSEAGHDARMQTGFDAGFLSGAKATADAGYWLGVSAVIEAYHARKNKNIDIDIDIDIEEVREARKTLEKAANAINENDDDGDDGGKLDTGAVRAACTKIVGNLPSSSDGTGDIN